MALAALSLASPALARVAPLTPEGRQVMAARMAFETHARQAFGDHGLVEKLRDNRRTHAFILVGRDNPRAAPRLMIKDAYGWYEQRPGESRRLPAELGHAIDRQLSLGELGEDDPYRFKANCQGTPRPFIVSFAGQDRFGRLGCGADGPAARAARIAETRRAGAGGGDPPEATLRDRPPGMSAAQHSANSQISARLFDMAGAWERKSLAAFVDPYAEDAIVERPETVLRGRKAIVDWTRRLQDWDGPFERSGFTMHRAEMKSQPADTVFYEQHEFRWEQDGRPVRQTFSTMWRNDDGLWKIAHERVSAVKPVTDARQTW